MVFTSEVVADFVNDLSNKLIHILRDLQNDKASFEKLGITFEEKAFFDILVEVRDDHGFPYAKNQLNMELTILLYKNDYPPEWDEEVFEKVMEQTENFKRCNS